MNKLLNLVSNNILDIIFNYTKSDYIVAKENDDKLEQIYVENSSDNSIIDKDVTCINVPNMMIIITPIYLKKFSMKICTKS